MTNKTQTVAFISVSVLGSWLASLLLYLSSAVVSPLTSLSLCLILFVSLACWRQVPFESLLVPHVLGFALGWAICPEYSISHGDKLASAFLLTRLGFGGVTFMLILSWLFALGATLFVRLDHP